MKDDIARARQQVDHSEKQVAWQRRLVADLKERGYATRREAEQLSVFESSLRAYQAMHAFLTQREAAPRLSPTKQNPQSAGGAKPFRTTVALPPHHRTAPPLGSGS